MKKRGYIYCASEVLLGIQITKTKVNMATIPDLKVLFFDVFGTCVMQRKPVADLLHNATQKSLESSSSISAEVRDKASKIV